MFCFIARGVQLTQLPLQQLSQIRGYQSKIIRTSKQAQMIQVLNGALAQVVVARGTENSEACDSISRGSTIGVQLNGYNISLQNLSQWSDSIYSCNSPMLELLYRPDLGSGVIRHEGWSPSRTTFGSVSLIGKAEVLKTSSNHLRRGVSVRVGSLPLVIKTFSLRFSLSSL